VFAARLNPPPPSAGPRPNIPYRASSPEYAMNLFVWNAPAVTATHLRRLTEAGFTWQKTRIPWAEVEWYKDQFNWDETDRIVQASNNAGVKVIVRVDVTPLWARPDNNPHGPPLRYQDYGDFLYALVNRYKTGSRNGRVHAVEVWNEPNLHKEWGNQPVNRQQAADYVRLLRAAYEGVKRADPTVMVISGSLSPTGWNDDTARPDDVYLHWMYDAGAASWFDALGLHGAGYGSAPETMPMTVDRYPHPSFYFRRAEQGRLPGARLPAGARAVGALDRRHGAVDHARPAVDPAPGGVLVGDPRSGRHGAPLLSAPPRGPRKRAASAALRRGARRARPPGAGGRLVE
jgi:cellulase (glycosyl hydrolase family 5)